MPKPAILTIDDDAHVLSAIERDLNAQYGRDYRIIKAESGAEALEVVTRLKERNAPLALFLVDERMPGMTGTEFLLEARQLYPQARKVLLTAYADTEAAIKSINEVGLDHYLMKPWDPPEANLYPVLDDLLSDWLATVPAPYDGIRVAGTLWSPTSHAAKDFLARNRIPFQWLDIEWDDEARALVDGIQRDQPGLPVVFFPDGTALVRPDNQTLAEKVGLQTTPSHPFYDLIIVGAGPAGLGAAVYGASEGFRTVLIEREATGGQAGSSSRIENYLGFPKGLSGFDLARRASAQARRLGAEILTAQEVTAVRAEDQYRYVTLADGTELGCKTLVIATGMSVRRLDVPRIDELIGGGVYYGAAVTEAANYRDQEVFVVGGANSAGQGAMLLSQYASKVTILVRAPAIERRQLGEGGGRGMSQYLVDQIAATPNIEVRTQTEVVELHGHEGLAAISVRDNATGEEELLPAAAMFLFIGARPHSEIVAGVVERNDAGFILTGSDLMRGRRGPRNWTLDRPPFSLETSVPGIFATGDVRQGAIRRVAAAVGEGGTAIHFVHQYLQTV